MERITKEQTEAVIATILKAGKIKTEKELLVRLIMTIHDSGAWETILGDIAKWEENQAKRSEKRAEYRERSKKQ